VALSFLKC